MRWEWGPITMRWEWGPITMRWEWEQTQLPPSAQGGVGWADTECPARLMGEPNVGREGPPPRTPPALTRAAERACHAPPPDPPTGPPTYPFHLHTHHTRQLTSPLLEQDLERAGARPELPHKAGRRLGQVVPEDTLRQVVQRRVAAVRGW
jgi:hypothetical protein